MAGSAAGGAGAAFSTACTAWLTKALKGEEARTAERGASVVGEEVVRKTGSASGSRVNALAAVGRGIALEAESIVGIEARGTGGGASGIGEEVIGKTGHTPSSICQAL